MHEILFRGKPKNKEHLYFFSEAWKENFKDGFVYGSLIIDKDRCFIAVSVQCNINFCVNNGLVSIIEVDPSTVGQYTGLTDKNGKKIFEGDIVNVFVKNRTYIIFNNRKGEVCFKDGVTFIKGISEHLSLYAFSNYCEVIGNIHDNPELLKGGDDK